MPTCSSNHRLANQPTLLRNSRVRGPVLAQAVHFMLDLLGKDELIKKHIETRTSWTTGYEVMSWKDACGVPQRGS